MNKKLLTLRLLFCRNGYKKADYLKRIKYFHSQGDHCMLIPYNYGTEPYLISFGDNDIVATGVSFVTHDATSFMFQNMNKEKKYTKRVGKIEVGNNVFIGANSTILYDVKIGDNVIIAAGSLVNKDVPSGTVYGGVPAKQIGIVDSYMKKMEEYSDSIPWDDSMKNVKDFHIDWCWNK